MARFTDRLSSPLCLVAANVAVFLLVTGLAWIIPASSLLEAFELPGAPASFAARPWTAVTYMWINTGFLQLLFNMLWLYWFGQLFLTLGTDGQLYRLYLAGGLAGAVCFMAASMLPAGYGGGALLGSSASVLAIVVATAWRMPDFTVGMFMFGGVRIKWIAVALVALSAINLSGGNFGGNVAHLGGAAMGMLFGLMIRRGTDITWPRMTRRRRHNNYTHTSPSGADRLNDTERLNAILEKVKRSGYASLNSEERRLLLDLSKRL